MSTIPVSAVLPAFNAERYLGEAIESVLAQTAAPRQIVVVNDGSTDATTTVVANFPAVTLVQQPHSGVGAALNRGFTATTEPYVAFLDADDVWLPDKLQKQWALMESLEPPDMVFGHMQNFFSPDAGDDLRRRVECPPLPLAAYAAGSMLVRRKVLEQVGLFDTDLRIGQFIDWYNRAVDLGMRHVMLPDVVLRRRLHGANLSLRDSSRVDFVRIAKRAIERRRRAT